MAALLLAGGLSGCVFALDRTPPLLTPEEVVAMHRAGVPASVISAKVLVSRTGAPMTVLEMVRLQDAGVDEEVIAGLVASSALPRGGVVYYQAPYGPFPGWTADDGVAGDPAAHPYRDHPDWVHRERVYEAK